MGIRRNRNGNTSVSTYRGYEIHVRRRVRNDSDKTFSVIVTEPLGDGYLIKKRISKLRTFVDQLNAMDKARKWINQEIIKNQIK